MVFVPILVLSKTFPVPVNGFVLPLYWTDVNPVDVNAFNSIIAMIQDSKSLPVNAQADVNNVIKIMDAYNFVDEKGELKYPKVKIDFYAGNRFWKLGFNNTVIAHLYSILGISEMPKNSVDFRVFVPRIDDKLKYPEGMPFGENNLDGINGYVKINKY